MPMRRTIGISLACLVTSACAIGDAPEQSTSHYPGEGDVPQGNEELTISKSFDLFCGAAQDPVRAVRKSQYGKASWYDHIGGPTASGEILDDVTPTAAHRSLPLASYAKVTNLDNSRSVIVKINDRGPYIRGRIIDLSPRAADTLDMKDDGVVAVLVEPLVYPAVPTVAAF